MSDRPVQKAKATCCVTIGYRHYLLPADAGMKLVALLQDAVECDEKFDGNGYVYHVGDAPMAELKIVRPNQIRMPHGIAEPVGRHPTKPRLLK